MTDKAVTGNEMAKALDNLKNELTTSLSTLEEKIKPLEESIAGLEQSSGNGDPHPSSMCFQDTCEPCKAHLSHVVQQARKGLLAELAQASRWAKAEQQMGVIIEGYQRWEKEGRPEKKEDGNSDGDKKGVTIDLGEGRTIDVVPN